MTEYPVSAARQVVRGSSIKISTTAKIVLSLFITLRKSLHQRCIVHLQAFFKTIRRGAIRPGQVSHFKRAAYLGFCHIQTNFEPSAPALPLVLLYIIWP